MEDELANSSHGGGDKKREAEGRKGEGIIDEAKTNEDYDKTLESESFTSKLLKVYVPISGVVGSCVFSIHVMHPQYMKSLFEPFHAAVANLFWFNAHIGIGLYIYSRPHIKVLECKKRLMYSIFGSVLYNFSSVLLWATTKMLLPENGPVRVAAGLSSTALLLYIGKDYLKYVDDESIIEDHPF